MKFLVKGSIIGLLLILYSCNSYLQIHNISSELVPIKSNQYVYENDTVKVTYNFWNSNGIMSFTLNNKLNIPIYIDWKKCSYISNSFKSDYWTDIEYATTKSLNNSYFYNPNIKSKNQNLLGTTFGTSSTTTKRDERITFIPPKSYISKSDFVIYPFQEVDLSKGALLDSNLESENKKVFFKTFNKQTSPVVFRNFLSYSVSESFLSELYIDNEFYVDSISELKYKIFDSKFIDPKSFYTYFKKYKRFRKGLINYTDIGFIFRTSSQTNYYPDPVYFSIYTVLGYKIANRVSLGIGTGADFLGYPIIPLFADLRYDIGTKNVTPVGIIQAGYTFALDGKVTEPFKIDYQGGYTINAMVGIKMKFTNNGSLILSLGYNWLKQFSYYYNPNLNTDISRIDLINRIALRIGFEFH